MTPLAHQLARDLCLPRAGREVQDQVDLKNRLDNDLHCFECSALGELIDREIKATGGGSFELVNELLPRTFLPSPRTWLEMSFALESDDSRSFRMAFWLEQPNGPGTAINVSPMVGRCDWQGDKGPPFTFDADPIRIRSALEAPGAKDTWNRWFQTMIVLTLALINASGLVEQRQERPHKGLQKQLDKVMPGRFALHEWHTVQLPAEHHGQTDEQRASASKCLHFVRSHLRRYRVRAAGATILIPAHWRGDPGLGIKRTRYEVQPERDPCPRSTKAKPAPITAPNATPGLASPPSKSEPTRKASSQP